MVTRQFAATAGARQVTVRYRLQTTEPWSPSPQDDGFYVELHAQGGNTTVSDYQTVYSVWNYLDQNGATAWRTLTLESYRDRAESELCESGHCGLRIVARFVLGRRDVPDRFEQAPGVEPIDPLERREFYGLQTPPRARVVESPPS